MKLVKGFFCAFVVATACAHADIYKWVDAQGGVHYSDTPAPGAQRMIIPGVQTFSNPNPAPTAKDIDNSQTLETANAKKGYRALSIIQPANQATIRNNQGYVLINADIEPALKDGDLLQIIFDGNPFGKPQSNLSFALSNINRGTHHVAVQVIDKNGHMILTSKPVEFYMQRPRVNMGGV